MTTKIINISGRASEALDGSIQKWAKIVEAFDKAKADKLPFWDAEYEENAASDCPLCALYHPDNTKGEEWKCSRACPIRLDTGKNFCAKTPYDDWSGDDPDDGSSPRIAAKTPPTPKRCWIT